MLINCPKCGFSQPKDRYCASCGVDMENFKPTRPSLLSRIFGSPILHIAFIFGLAFVAVMIVRQQKKVEIRQRAEYLQGGPVVVARANRNTAEDSTARTRSDSSGTVQPAPAPVPAKPAQGEMGSRTSDSDSVKPTLSRAIHKITPDEKSLGKISAYYVEMNSQAVRNLILDSQSTGQFNQFGAVSWGMIPDMDQKIARLSGSTVHQKVEQAVSAKNLEPSWYVGTQGGNAEFGLVTAFFFNEFSANNVRGELEIRRNLPELDGTKISPVTRVFPATFDLPPKAGFMIVGILPHKISMETVDTLKPDSLFKIYNSKKFETGDSEFVLLIQFDASSASDSAVFN